jgi:hypothetical protein
MHVWIVLFTLILPKPPVVTMPGASTDDDDPMRYRGIERLLAKFEAQDDKGR